MKNVIIVLIFTALSTLTVYGNNIPEGTSIQCSWLNSVVYQSFINTDYLNFEEFQVEARSSTEDAGIAISAGFDRISGKFEIAELTDIVADGENTIETAHINYSAGARLETGILDIGFEIHDKLPGGEIKINTPPLSGFSLGLEAGRMRYGEFLGLPREYSLDCSVILDSANAFLQWENETAAVYGGFGFTYPRIFSYRENIESDVHIQLDGGSDLDLLAGFSLHLPEGWELKEESLLSFMSMRISGAVDNLRFVDIYNPSQAEKLIDLYYNSHLLEIVYPDGGMSGRLVFRNITVPIVADNDAYIDAGPLSPVGLLYMLKYIFEDFGGCASLAELKLEKELKISDATLILNAGFNLAAWDVQGIGYSVEGTAGLPFLIWDLETSPKEHVAEKGMLFAVTPDFTFRLPAENIIFSAELSQFIPLYLDSALLSVGFDEAGTDFIGGTTIRISATFLPDY